MRIYEAKDKIVSILNREGRKEYHKVLVDEAIDYVAELARISMRDRIPTQEFIAEAQIGIDGIFGEE